jgi:hypothetical protein
VIRFILIALLIATPAFAAKQTLNNGETFGTARSKINSNFTEVYAGILIGDCTAAPCYDGTENSGTLIKLMGVDGVHWSSIQAGNVLANINWRLPLTLPGAGTTRLINSDEYGNMGLVDPATFATPTGSAANMTVDASGFDGNLETTDNTIQEIAQALDDLVAGSGSVSDTAYGATWDGDTTTAPSKNAVYDKIETLAGGHDAVTLDTETAAIFSLTSQLLTLDSQTANYVFAAPNGSAGDPTFRALVVADIPTLTRAKISDLGTSAQYDVGTAIGNIVRLADSGGNPALPFTINLFDLNDGNAGAIDVPGVAGQVMTFGTNGALTWASKQDADSDLTTWAGVTPSSNGQSLVSAANYAAMRGLLDLESGTDFNVAASDSAAGIIELATTAETSTGTSTTLAVTPDGLSGSVYGQKEIGWFVTASGTATTVADGTQAAVVPASMNGMNLVDVTCSVHALNSAASGATTVVLRRVRGATAADMTSTGVTINYDEYTASDETVDTSNDDVATGDKIYVDVNAITSAAHQGLSCTAVFQTP